MFIISAIAFTFLIDKTVPKEYADRLPPATKAIYRKVVAERRQLANQGLLIGLIIGLILAAAFAKGRLLSACTVAASAFGIQYLYYMLSPKSDWMVRHMHMPHERAAWLRVHQHYQRMYHASIALGVIGAAIVGFSIC